jgi:hypothetical protein
MSALWSPQLTYFHALGICDELDEHFGVWRGVCFFTRPTVRSSEFAGHVPAQSQHKRNYCPTAEGVSTVTSCSTAPLLPVHGPPSPPV